MAVIVRLVDIIGEDVEDFLDKLPKDSEDVVVEINSPGGDVFAGISIYNKLKELQGNVRVDILGLAASAASLVAMAGDEIIMRKNSRMMIHNPFTGRMGDAKKFEKTAEELRDIENTLVDIYSQKTGIAKGKIREMMDEETWMSAEQAVKNKFATKVQDIKEKQKNAKDFMQQFAQLGFVNIPNDLDPKFSTEPWKPQNGYDDNGRVNVNALRYTLSLSADEEAQKLLDEFKQENPDYKSKIALKYIYKGKEQTFLFTEQEIKMLSQTQELLKKVKKALGVDDDDKILEKANELIEEAKKSKTAKIDDSEVKETVQELVSENAELKEQNSKLEEEVESLKDGVQALTDEMKEQSKFKKNSEIKARDEHFLALKKSGHMSDKEVERAKKLWDVSRESYDIFINFLETDEPRYKGLTEEQGSAGDGKNEPKFKDSEDKGTAVAQKVQFHLAEMKKDEKYKEFSTQQLLDELEKTEPELVQNYYLGA